MTKAQRKIAIRLITGYARDRRAGAKWYAENGCPLSAKVESEESRALFAAARALRKVVCDG